MMPKWLAQLGISYDLKVGGSSLLLSVIRLDFCFFLRSGTVILERGVSGGGGGGQHGKERVGPSQKPMRGCLWRGHPHENGKAGV